MTPPRHGMPVAPALNNAIPHHVKRHLVTRCLNPEGLKAPYAWGRELKLLNKLIDRHPSQAFWDRFEPAYSKPRSFAVYVNGMGARDLAAAYQRYMVDFETSNPSAIRHHVSALGS